MVYAGRIIKELGLLDGYTLVMTGTVQEEDCDGLCWQYLVKEMGLRPEFVVSTEPTDGNIYRGQRGRMEIRVEVKGVSAHGSAPERGDNAIFKMGRILGELEELHGRLKTDDFLGKGSLTVSEIFYTSPSRCAVADGCAVSVDRRLTAGEDRDLALGQIRELPAARAAGAEVSMYTYAKPSHTGLVYPTECYFPSWVLAEGHRPWLRPWRPTETCLNRNPRWTSGPFPPTGSLSWACSASPAWASDRGREDQAHAPNEKTWKADLVRCAAFYAALPLVYLKGAGAERNG